MKKSSPVTRLMIVALFSSVIMIGCKKEHSDSLSPAEEEQAVNYSTQSETETEVVFNDIFDNVLGVNTEVGIGGTGIFGRIASNGREMNPDSLPSCTQVNITVLNAPARFPMRITIDFGAGCLGRDGHKRSGKIITEYTGKLTEPGNSATTRFENFKFDSIAVQGTHKLTNSSTPGGNQRQFTIDIADARLSKPNGDYSLSTSHRVITQIEGNGTAFLPQDDIFKITGSAHGKVKQGNLLYGWRSEIIEPLIKKFSCRWLSKGIILVKREGANNQWEGKLNYGQGDCDFLATLTINGASRQIQLPH